MTFVSFREALRRFRHIDAELVRATSELSPESEGTVEVVVRFYPWWEHPKYLEAIARGDGWGFAGYETGAREVTVRAVRPSLARLSGHREVTS